MEYDSNACLKLSVYKVYAIVTDIKLTTVFLFKFQQRIIQK